MYQVMPELNSEEYLELKADIEARGVMVPIELDENGNVLDGHHRIKICQELGITDFPRVIRAGMTEAEKRLHARKLNMARRHLSQEQRRSLIRGQLMDTPEKSDRQIAAGLGVSHVTVGGQRKSMESTGQIDRLNTNIGADGKERPRQVQRRPVAVFNPTPREERALQNPAVLEKLTTGEAKTVTDAYRQAVKAATLAKYEDTDGEAPQYADIYSTDKKYRVFYGDPPWEYGDARSGAGTTGATDHYPTMVLADICALPIERIAEENAVLFLWTTSPMLEDSFGVVNAWGFRYKTSFIWDKVKHNMGHYNSVRHELLLVCTRGRCTPDVPALYDSVQQIARTEHSRKPEKFRDIIDAIYPHGNRIELFARGCTGSWDAWGYEAK